jgi:predicted PurR-regulated permease PerM
MANVSKDPQLRYAIAAWVIAALMLLLALLLHLMPALLAGLLVYELVHVMAPRLPWTREGGGKLAAVAILAAVVVTLLALLMFGVVAFLRSEASMLPAMLQKLADVIEASRGKIPAWLLATIPGDPESLKEVITEWVREHAHDLRTLGGEVGHVVAHILIGMVIGAMVSLREGQPEKEGGPLSRALTQRATRVGDAFRRVVFAQVRISALNTLFTAIYLLGILPLLGVHLPFAKTLVAFTFVVGLLPVVGNLISNTAIVLVSLGVSLPVAISSLAFLVIVHKLEYFLNAKIVGTQIRSSPWELLLAMLLMESAFGIPGLIAAPIYYAYLKDELAARGLV